MLLKPGGKFAFFYLEAAPAIAEESLCVFTEKFPNFNYEIKTILLDRKQFLPP